MKPIFANLDAAADGNTEQEAPSLGYAEYNPSRKIKQEAEDKLQQEMGDVLNKLRERCKRTVLRKIETGEVTYDK
jgi:hypothetical protein